MNCETKKSVEKIWNDRRPDFNNIPAELIKVGRKVITESLKIFFDQTLEEKQVQCSGKKLLYF